MLTKSDISLSDQVNAWLQQLNKALNDHNPAAVEILFSPECHWRNLCGITWQFCTFSGKETVAKALQQGAANSEAINFTLSPKRIAPHITSIAEVEVLQAAFQFETPDSIGIGIVRLIPGPEDENALQAWTFMTAIEQFKTVIPPSILRVTENESHSRSFKDANWRDNREAEVTFADHDPEVLIIGGGHAGMSAAVELKQLGINSLIIDKEERIGDNWRLRYHSLKLHNRTPANHMLYMPFPDNWPAYIPKDKIANWFEHYAESMELNFWTRTTFKGAKYDSQNNEWIADVLQSDGTTRTMRPKHIIMATSVSNTPNIPTIPTLDQFSGPVIHSSEFKDGANWKGKSVLVLGTGTSGHDISQDLHANGARVTMVQRNPTLIVNVDPSAQLYDGIYLGEGPSTQDRDLVNTSVPLEVIKKAHHIITKTVEEMDAPLLDRLEKAGFQVEAGIGSSGWPLKFRTRGGGYYFNVGCSEIIADGEISILQNSEIQEYTKNGVKIRDGSEIEADLVILATGYHGPEFLLETYFGKEVLDRVGPIWGFNETNQELRNMWVQTGQPGLWFTGGAFSQCRMYSKYLAAQIKAIDLGLLELSNI